MSQDLCTVYVVRAYFSDAQTRAEYEAWLLNGHVAAVERTGALSAAVCRWDQNSDTGETAIETRYVFRNRVAFAAYEADHAPQLRADGVRLFGPNSGKLIRFERSVGDLCYSQGDSRAVD